jgi:hypothetical protein
MLHPVKPVKGDGASGSSRIMASRRRRSAARREWGRRHSRIAFDRAAASGGVATDLRSIVAPHLAGKADRRFRIAAPLRTSDGYDLGTLCVIDRKSIRPDARRTRQLETLAAIVMDQLEVRLASRRAEANAGLDEYELCVLDEGPGLPDGFAPERHVAGSLGMKLVALLTSQLSGRLSAGANPAGRGACFVVTFPAS